MHSCTDLESSVTRNFALSPESSASLLPRIDRSNISGFNGSEFHPSLLHTLIFSTPLIHSHLHGRWQLSLVLYTRGGWLDACHTQKNVDYSLECVHRYYIA